MRYRVDNVGSIGLITDKDPNAIPPEAWTVSLNVRFAGNSAETFLGRAKLYDPDDDLTYTEGFYLVSVADSGDSYLVFPYTTTDNDTGNKVASFNGTACTDKTRSSGDYTGVATDLWSGCVLHGIAILTNNVDAPQYTTGSSTCQNLTWDGVNDWEDYAGGGETYTCKVIRSYKNYLFALNITDDGTNYPHMIHWSNPADPGAIPQSWEYDSTESLSGRTQLSDSTGFVIDALKLKDTLIIYKQDMVYTCVFTGGTYQFQIRPLFNDRGLYSSDCVVDIGGAHICLGATNIYLHDGNTYNDIADDKTRDAIFDSIDYTNYEKTFLVHDEEYSEVWIVYPSSGSDKCNRAWVYNYALKTWSEHTPLSETNHIAPASGLIEDDTWDKESILKWNSEALLTWGFTNYSPLRNSMISISDQIYNLDYGHDDNGSDYLKVIQKTHINLGDESQWHLVNAIYPNMTGTQVEVRIGHHDVIEDAITWGAYQTFTPGEDKKLDVRSTGPLHAIEFRSSDDQFWRLNSYTLDYEQAGRR